MAQVDYIKAEIEALSPEEFVRLREWIVEKDWALWDEQLANDALAGKLEFLRREAETAKAKGQLKAL